MRTEVPMGPEFSCRTETKQLGLVSETKNPIHIFGQDRHRNSDNWMVFTRGSPSSRLKTADRLMSSWHGLQPAQKIWFGEAQYQTEDDLC